MIKDQKDLKLTNDNLLDLYALYKQGTTGDVNTGNFPQASQPNDDFPWRLDRPGMFDLKGKAKWDAWEKRKGTNIKLNWIVGPHHDFIAIC